MSPTVAKTELIAPRTCRQAKALGRLAAYTMWFLLATQATASTCLIDDAKLDRLLRQEIDAALDSPRRFEALPRNIASVFASPRHEPCFTIKSTAPNRRASFAGTLDRCGPEGVGFRLLWGSWMIGSDPEGGLAIVSGDRESVAIIRRDEQRVIDLPKGTDIYQACWVRGQWVFSTSLGFIAEGQRAFPENPPMSRMRAVTDGQRLMAYRSRHEREDGSGGTLWIRLDVLEDGRWTAKEFRGVPLRQVRGFIRRQDGTWLAIGNKILALRQDLAAAPTNKELQAAIALAEQAKWDELVGQLPRLTTYTPESLRPLVTVLRELPDHTDGPRRLGEVFDRVLMSAAEWRGTAHSDLASHPRLNDVLTTYESATRKAIADLNGATGHAVHRSPHLIARMLSDGYQFYNDTWITVQYVVHQESPGGALLRCSYFDERCAAGTRQGFFRLGDDGRLQRFGSPSLLPAWSCGRPTIVRGRDRHLLAFSKGSGLAQLEDDRLVWLEQSPRMKSMDRLIGQDRSGRLYFERSANRHERLDAGTARQLWVVDLRKPVEDPEAVPMWPVHGRPVVDPQGRLWLLAKPPRAGQISEPRPAGLPLLDREDVVLSSETKLSTRESAAHRYGHGHDSRLCCLAKGKLLRYRTNEPVRGNSLIKGVNGGFWLTRGSGKPPIVMVTENALYGGEDLHDLAQKHFDVTLRHAPEEVLPDAYPAVIRTRFRDDRAVVLRTGTLLWVPHRNKVEVYKDGEALLVGKRLALLGGNPKSSYMLGPVRFGPAPSVLVLTGGPRLRYAFWVTPTEEGIAVAKAGLPPCEWPNQGMLSDPGRFTGLPLLDPAGRAYFHHGCGRVWLSAAPGDFSPLPDAGAPALLQPGRGGFLAWRWERVRQGYRFVMDDRRVDIAALYVKPFEPVHFEDDGRLLCLAPDGLAWLRLDAQRQASVNARRIICPHLTLIEYLGQSDEHLFMMAAQGSRRYAVAVPRGLSAKFR